MEFWEIWKSSTPTRVLFTVFFNFKSHLNVWIWILFTMPNFIFSSKKALAPCFHTTLRCVASLARELFGSWLAVTTSWKNKSNFFAHQWEYLCPAAPSWLLCSGSLPGGHYTSVLSDLSTFNPVHDQLQFFPSLDFLTNSHSDWEDRVRWFTALPWVFRSSTGSLCVHLQETASQPVQHTSEFLQCSPEVWQQGQRPDVQLPGPRPCKGDEGPILEELTGDSALTYYGFSALPESLMQPPQDVPPCSGHLPSHLHPQDGTGGRRTRKVTARWRKSGRTTFPVGGCAERLALNNHPAPPEVSWH